MDKKIFKEVIQEIIRKSDYKPERPRSFFVKAINTYKRRVPKDPISMYKSLFFDYQREEALFMEILDELKVKVKEGVLRRMSVVVNNMKRGAVVKQRNDRRGAFIERSVPAGDR